MSALTEMGHEEVVFFHSRDLGLKAIVAIHDTTLGPALGGCRMLPYKSEDEALYDVLRLSRGMTYKNAVAGLNLGGGKSVIIGDPKKDKSEAFFRAFGRFIESLGGRYITAEDVNTSVDDMVQIFQETRHVTGIPAVFGGSGDPSPFTALGTFRGIEAAAEHKYGSKELSKLSFAVQGAGHVGVHLIRMLRETGAKVYVSDPDADRIRHVVEKFGAEALKLDEIYDTDAKVFVPCALGGSVNPETLDKLHCEIVAGSANNQLDTDATGDELEKRGVLYVPDYVINAGGVINVAIELQGYNKDRATHQVNRIFDICKHVFHIAEHEGLPTYKAADHLAEKRIAEVGKVRRPYLPARRAPINGRHALS
ncbi:MAG TPA: Glu/Leu/Phe/Val dehydrogenase [Gammaproteobacteria bacterium]|nr:Glu/Leu/Phe/Val dehydrogenase [Gammaproteobacteria bacterium]